MKKIAYETYETPTASFCGLEMYGFICGSYGGVGVDDSVDNEEEEIEFDFIQ